MLAALEQVLSLLELALPELACRKSTAVTIHPVGEVLASNADLLPFPIGQLTFFDELPPLHYSVAGTLVLNH